MNTARPEVIESRQAMGPWVAAWAADRVQSLLVSRAGALMLEAIVGVTVLSVLATAALIGLSATQKARGNLERQAIMENLARNQMEYLFSQTYQTASSNYASITPTRAGYVVTSTQELVTAGDTDLQKITLVIAKDGRVLISLETYRSNEKLRNLSP